MADALAVTACDARTGAIIDELPVASFDWSPSIGQTSQVSATITASLSQAKKVFEGATVVHLSDRTTIIGGNGFLINQVQWKDQQLTLTGDSLRNWLDRRNLRSAKNETSRDQFTIASDLLDYANASSLGVGVTFRGSPGSTSGVNRAINYPADRTPIGQLIDNLATLDNGFDWDITAEWSGHAIVRHLDCWYPARGQVTQLVWEHGKNCKVDTYTSDASKLATLVEIAGNSSTATQTYGAASESPVGFPRYDLLDTAKTTDETNAGNAAALNAKATAALTRNHAPLETCVVTGLAMGDLDDTNVERWGIGDQIILAADIGFRVLSGVWRIVSPSYKFAGGKLIADQVTLARPLPGDPIRPPDGMRELGAVARKVRVLERR